jgi:DEAD/DEAH box helicase domain-containing protein
LKGNPPEQIVTELRDLLESIEHRRTGAVDALPAIGEPTSSVADMLDVFQAAIATKFAVVEQIELPARPERRGPVPAAFTTGRVGMWLSRTEHANTLWTHQIEALNRFEAGSNIVVATGTASGKSLIFQAAALRTLDRRPNAAVLVFYPLKALVGDQLVSWRTVLSAAGLPENSIARLDGDVLPDERDKLIETARVILATPDVTHAWLMRNLAKPTHRRFLSRLALVVVDEAHVFESVFGSNFAFLFRRLVVAARFSDRTATTEPLRVVAASATISNPREHMAALTGMPFEAIDGEFDGSPQQTRQIVHLASGPGQEASIAADLHRILLEESRGGSFLTFIDSRQGAERLTIRTDAEDVRPYRSGFEAADRSAIEQALRVGSLRGVVSTSALELGINIPHFSVGLNLGIPASRKSFRQRLGRVGRQKPGAFAILADAYALRRFGMSLEDYYSASIEPAHLYLFNRFIQYAHARCLADELEMMGASGRKTPPGFVEWPGGFKNIFDFAYIGSPAARPREFDQIHRIGGDNPHLQYPLRSVAEEGFVIATGGGASGPQGRVGTLTLQQALREAFPGAIYLHMSKGWKVFEWRSTTWERSIRVAPTNSRAFPKPLLRTFVNVSLEHDGIVDGRFRSSEAGYLSECQLQITERVEGLEDRGERKLYRDMQISDPNMRAKTREFRTTGIVFRIGEPWFASKGIKTRIAEAMTELLRREYSISPSDVDHAATNIAVVRDGQRSAVTDAFVIYDATHGSLRLSEPAYTCLDTLIERLKAAISMTPAEEDLLPPELVEALEGWYTKLRPEGEDLPVGLPGGGPEGWLQVYAPGSIVCRRGLQGVLIDIEIESPELITDADSPMKLYYRYRSRNDVRAMTPADQIEAVGDQWSFTYWNPQTGEYSEEMDDLSTRNVDRPVGLVDSLSEVET